jgi:hypothetical protein
MAKARHGGPAYIYSILTGYQNQPAELLKKFPAAKTPPSLHYNPYFATLNIAMPPPLHGGDVTFADGTPNTLQQEAKDVSAFLMWTAELTCRPPQDRLCGARLPDRRDDPGLSELPEHLGRAKRRWPVGPGSGQQGQADPRQQKGRD